MYKDNYSKDEVHRILNCINHKCWSCDRATEEGEVFVCTDFSCPLWLYKPEFIEFYDDLHDKHKIYVEMCKKIYESKKV